MKLLHFLSLLFALLFAGSAFAAAEFQIISFDLSENLVSVASGDSVDVNAVVKIRNIGDAGGNETLTIVLKDNKNIVKTTMSAPSTTLVSNEIEEHSLTFTIPGTWDAGIYSFYASVYDDSDGLLDDQKLKTLTLAISKPPPVPELPILLVPLAAFSVLAFLFFSGRKQF